LRGPVRYDNPTLSGYGNVLFVFFQGNQYEFLDSQEPPILAALELGRFGVEKKDQKNRNT
jgi:hypothetical protein